MKKIFFLISLLLLLFPFVSSVQTEINDDYNLGETIIAKISGNFLDDIQKNNVFFYRRHMPTSISPYDVVKISDSFYVYAKVGLEKIPDNYSMVIKDIRYMEGIQISDEDIVLNFTIVGDVSDFSVYPGALIAYDDFSVEVQNLQNYPIDVNIETSNLSFSENLLSGEIKQIWFGIANQSEFMTINLSSENQGYEIFTHLFYTLPVTNETTNETQNNETNQTQGNETNQTNENTTIIEEDIIEEDDVIEDILTEDDVIEELGDIPAFENEGGVLETCSEKNGIVCEDDEKCEGETESAKEIICCLGVCNEVEKSNTGKIVGWILIILIAGVLIWLYIKKSKKKKKPVNLLKIAGNRK